MARAWVAIVSVGLCAFCAIWTRGNWDDKGTKQPRSQGLSSAKVATDVVLAWKVWKLRIENPLSRIWSIVVMADISATRLTNISLDGLKIYFYFFPRETFRQIAETSVLSCCYYSLLNFYPHITHSNGHYSSPVCLCRQLTEKSNKSVRRMYKIMQWKWLLVNELVNRKEAFYPADELYSSGYFVAMILSLYGCMNTVRSRGQLNSIKLGKDWLLNS